MKSIALKALGVMLSSALAYYHERPTEIDAEIEYERYLKERREAGLVPV